MGLPLAGTVDQQARGEACGIRSCQDRRMAQREPGPPEYRLGDAVLETMRGALRILGGTVQMAVGMTRMLAGAVLKVAAVAEKAVRASEEDEESYGSVPARIESGTTSSPSNHAPVDSKPGER